MDQQPEIQKSEQDKAREEIIKNLSCDGIREALQKEFDQAKKDLEFCLDKVQIIEKSLARFEDKV